MFFERILPSPALQHFVESYWVVKEDDAMPVQQKIIPDGYTEIVFHFADPYRINITGQWVDQTESLLAGQLKKHFFLENTGRADMLGIKFQPAALAQLFGLAMKPLTDHVVDLRSTLPQWRPCEQRVRAADSAVKRIALIEEFLLRQVSSLQPLPPIEMALRKIMEAHGMIQVSEITEALNVSERYLEQLFGRFVGISPKFYARIIRFSYIFQLLKEQQPNWMDLVVQAGYYDQSHFIRNFKAFTGEDPSAYEFKDQNLANFFLKK